MAKSVKSVIAKSGNEVSVMAGFDQLNYEDGSVGRVSAEFMADVADLAGIAVDNKFAVQAVMAVCVEALNEKFKPENPLDINEYDFYSGKYSRANPQKAKVVQEATQAGNVAVAQADAGVQSWIFDQFNAGLNEAQIIETMKAQNWSEEQLKPYFKSLQKKSAGVPVPPPPTK